MAEIAQSVVATRFAIFEQEFNAKAALLGKGLAAVTAAAALAVVALLLLAALLAALFSQLFHNVALGILVAMRPLRRGPPPAPATSRGSRSARIKPTEFPATSRELARDAEAIRAALAQDPDPEEGPDPDMPNDGRPDPEPDVSDLEARLRAGAE